MASLNRVTLIGNVGRDPDIRNTQYGRAVNFTVATTEAWTDKASGQRKEATEWHTVSSFADRFVDLAEKYISKGDKIMVEGKLKTRKWRDQNGNDHYSTEVVLDPFNGNIILLGSPRQRQGGGRAAPQTRAAPAPDANRPPPQRAKAVDWQAPDEQPTIPFDPPHKPAPGQGWGEVLNDEIPDFGAPK